MSVIPQRIKQLRNAMRAKGLNAYIIPSTDPHIGEYIPDRWKSREWISGFDGSAGTVIVTLDDAGLWTDSRYFLQGEMQLEGSGIQLFRAGLPGTPDILEWLTANLSPNSTAGIDGTVFTTNEVKRIESALAVKAINLSSDFDLIEEIRTDRPSIPGEGIFELPVEYAGVSASEKINSVRTALRENGANLTIISTLDEIAWVFNIRGNDVECNPVAVAYAVITESQSILFTDAKKISSELYEHLDREGITTADYGKITAFLGQLPSQATILFDGNRVNYGLRKAIPAHCRIVEALSPVALLKAVKNETEIEGFRNAMVKDGVALTRFNIWLEENLRTREISELDIAEKLYEFRDEQELFAGESFSPIVSYGEHGAIVHYHPTRETNIPIAPKGFLLIDSGGQYFDGTTDITRTHVLGEISDRMKKDFTLVLKGHIALAACRFPQGTRGSQLDILARQALWNEGLNYLHGTGHGIGHFLNVHEGPQSIRMEENPVKLQPGMVMSNEPAFYRNGEYGLRTENVVLIKEDIETPFGKFYCFETLTLFPIDKAAIDKTLLTEKEIQWINNYHATVFEKLSPKLEASEIEWLRQKTTAL
jgi:Xaa-Pro aminopeptidase